MEAKKVRASDGVMVGKGDRVFTTNCEWGTILDDPDERGWFNVQQENGKRHLLNVERVSSTKPSWL